MAREKCKGMKFRRHALIVLRKQGRITSSNGLKNTDLYRMLQEIEPQQKVSLISNEDFYKSPAWRRVRYQALLKHGAKCQCCGADKTTKVIHVDHIKPRSLFPALQLDINNLQVLCEDCNVGKSNIDETDWR